MHAHARFMAVAGALAALAPAAGAQRLAPPGTHSARSAFTAPLEAASASLGVATAVAPSAATLDVGPIVAPALADPANGASETAPLLATGSASFGGVALGGSVTHEAAASGDERAPFASDADDDENDEGGSATASNGPGWMPIAGALAGGGALFAALATNGGGAAAAAPVTVSTAGDTRAPAAEFQPIAPLAPMAAPEPATYAMLASGLVALALVARRRRAA